MSYQAANFIKAPAGFLKIVWLWTAISSIVLIEPAPYDGLFVVLMIAALLFSAIAFSSDFLLPVFFLSLFFEAGLISLFYAEEKAGAVKFFLITIYLAATWILWVGLLYRYRQEAMKAIFSGYLFAALSAVIVGTLAYFHLVPGSESFLYYGRVSGTFKDANVYGPFLVPVVVYSLCKFEYQKGFRLLLWLAGIVVLSTGVLLSFSRAAWGNYFISVLVYCLLPPWKKLKDRALKIFFVVILLLPVFFITVNSQPVQRLLIHRVGLQSYDSHRFGAQLDSLRLVIDHPMGIGPYQTEQVLDYSTHSLYVRVLTENGIPGFNFFLLFLLFTGLRSLRHNFNASNDLTYASVVTASLAGVLFNSFFVDTLHWRHFWLLLALPWIPFEGGVESENSANSDQV